MCVLPVIEAPKAATRSYFSPGPRWVGPALSSLAGIMVSVNASHPPQPAQLLASLACRGVVLVWENATSLPRPRTQWAEAAKTTFPYAQNPNWRDSYKEQTGKTCHFFCRVHLIAYDFVCDLQCKQYIRSMPHNPMPLVMGHWYGSCLHSVPSLLYHSADRPFQSNDYRSPQVI